VLGIDVEVPEPGEYVARGAARQAAWVVSGADDPPAWPIPVVETLQADQVPAVRDRYGQADGSVLSRQH